MYNRKSWKVLPFFTRTQCSNTVCEVVRHVVLLFPGIANIKIWHVQFENHLYNRTFIGVVIMKPQRSVATLHMRSFTMFFILLLNYRISNKTEYVAWVRWFWILNYSPKCFAKLGLCREVLTIKSFKMRVLMKHWHLSVLLRPVLLTFYICTGKKTLFIK